MSGHSKWATIKHKKGAADKARGKLFNKIARQLEVAAREGGGDPTTNATLRTMVQKAKAAQMTNDAIDRAIKRGTGENDGGTYETITYEGYAPGGVALLIDVLTDNRNRTGAEVRNVFSKLGGSMAEPGAVGWQFRRAGVLHVPADVAEDDVMLAALDAGAEDVSASGDTWEITCEPNAVYDVQAALEDAGITVLSARVDDGVVDHDRGDRSRGCARRCCASSTRSRTTTTCRTCSATSTSPIDHGSGRLMGSVGVGDRGAGVHAAGHRRQGLLAGGLRRPAGRPRVLPGRRHAGVHEAAQLVQQRRLASSTASAPRCSRSPARTSRATSASPPSTGSGSRCSPTSTRTSPAPTARSGRSGSRGAACSSSTVPG